MNKATGTSYTFPWPWRKSPCDIGHASSCHWNFACLFLANRPTTKFKHTNFTPMTDHVNLFKAWIVKHISYWFLDFSPKKPSSGREGRVMGDGRWLVCGLWLEVMHQSRCSFGVAGSCFYAFRGGMGWTELFWNPGGFQLWYLDTGYTSDTIFSLP